MTHEATGVLPRILDLAGLSRVILLGHSDGASIASIYAGSVADHRVRGLVLIAPHYFTEPDGLAAIARARDAFDQGDLRQALARHHADPENTFRGWAEAWLDPDFAAWNIGETLDYIRVPVLAIQGRRDQYGSLAQIEEVQERVYAPVDTLLLDESAHAPHLEQPAPVLDAITEFTARLWRIEAADVVPT